MTDTNRHASEATMTVWRRLKSAFPIWSLLFPGAIRPSSWGTIGNDLVSPLLRSGAMKAARRVLQPTTDSELAFLEAVSILNVRRQEHMFRTIAATMLTLPAGGAVLATELGFFAEDDGAAARALFLVLGLYLAIVGVYLAGLWRARMISHAITFLRLERALAAGETSTVQPPAT